MKVLEKVERRLGEKLFLKGDRCRGPKCAAVRRGTPPGMHGSKTKRGRRRGGSSEYGALLAEKQKVRFVYGLDDRDLERYSKKAVSFGGIYSANLVILLETRLDNVVFQLGFADSRRMARFLVSHGHIMVGNRRVSIPSYHVRKGEIISIKPGSLARQLFSGIEAKLSRALPPKWLSLDGSKKSGTVLGMPQLDDFVFTTDVAKIKEFYSR